MKLFEETLDTYSLEEKLRNGWGNKKIVIAENIKLPTDHPLKKNYDLIRAGAELKTSTLRRLREHYQVNLLRVNVYDK